jgi:hypothetical protein
VSCHAAQLLDWLISVCSGKQDLRAASLSGLYVWISLGSIPKAWYTPTLRPPPPARWQPAIFRRKVNANRLHLVYIPAPIFFHNDNIGSA